jgi:hypothetical protein
MLLQSIAVPFGYIISIVAFCLLGYSTLHYIVRSVHSGKVEQESRPPRYWLGLFQSFSQFDKVLVLPSLVFQ